VKTLLILSFLFLSTLFGTLLSAEDNISTENGKVLYMGYSKIPKRVVVGEIFSVTFKTVPTLKKFKNIKYTFSKPSGIKILHTKPKRSIVEQDHYDTFNFLVTKDEATLPNVTASIVGGALKSYPTASLKGEKLNVITLNPQENFANIIANSFELIEYKTTKFDDSKNILVFTAKAQNCDITTIKFADVFKQGAESTRESYLTSKITYFVVIDNTLETFSFSYFNLISNSYSEVNLPIILDDDSVVAQSDLKPKDQSKEQLKMKIAAAVALLIFLLILWKKKYKFLIILILPIGYIVSVVAPSKDVCVRSGANIHILPVPNGTIFEKTTQKSLMPNEGYVENFVKVKLKNDRIGWVKNEDLCTD